MKRVMIGIEPTTKNKWRNLQFPDYIKSDDAKILYIVDQIIFKGMMGVKYIDTQQNNV